MFATEVTPEEYEYEGVLVMQFSVFCVCDLRTGRKGFIRVIFLSFLCFAKGRVGSFSRRQNLLYNLTSLFSVCECSLCWVNRGFKVWNQSDDNNAALTSAASVSLCSCLSVRSCLGLWFWRLCQVLVSDFPNPLPQTWAWFYSDRVLVLIRSSFCFDSVKMTWAGRNETMLCVHVERISFTQLWELRYFCAKLPLLIKMQIPPICAAAAGVESSLTHTAECVGGCRFRRRLIRLCFLVPAERRGERWVTADVTVEASLETWPIIILITGRESQRRETRAANKSFRVEWGKTHFHAAALIKIKSCVL